MGAVMEKRNAVGNVVSGVGEIEADGVPRAITWVQMIEMSFHLLRLQG